MSVIYAILGVLVGDKVACCTAGFVDGVRTPELLTTAMGICFAGL